MKLDVALICPIRWIEISIFLKMSKSGLLDYFPQIWALLSQLPRSGVFSFLHPSLGDVVAVASQGRFCFCYTPAWEMLSQMPRRGVFFLPFLPQSGPKGHIWLKKVISGPDFLKNQYIWSDFIKLDLMMSAWSHIMDWAACYACRRIISRPKKGQTN